MVVEELEMVIAPDNVDIAEHFALGVLAGIGIIAILGC